MDTAEIRRRFLAHFEARGHLVVPSASLVSDGSDAAAGERGHGAVQAVLPRRPAAARPRATSVQKVVRTVDIENVGQTSRHASFFQMCGNFSFGDYFKAGAIPMAWELLTSVDKGYGFDPERLWATVYLDDDEAFELWQQLPARATGSSAAARKTTTGRWACPARAARAARSTSTAGPSTAPTAARGRRGALPRGLEPRLHAVRAGRGSGLRLPDPG